MLTNRYHIPMKLASTYPGYLELFSPYSENRSRLKVGRPGEDVTVKSKWRDQGVTWVLVELYNGEFEGWLLEEELIEDD